MFCRVPVVSLSGPAARATGRDGVIACTSVTPKKSPAEAGLIAKGLPRRWLPTIKTSLVAAVTQPDHNTYPAAALPPSSGFRRYTPAALGGNKVSPIIKRVFRRDFNWATAGMNLCWVPKDAAMPAPLQKTLNVVPAPLVEAVPRAPPALEMPNPTVEFTCGNCGAVLIRADEEKGYPLVVLCISCGSYNSTDT
jgi:predicted RNA-binding Zn-ribbon protein involved in translation (DUF1610 family)